MIGYSEAFTKELTAANPYK